MLFWNKLSLPCINDLYEFGFCCQISRFFVNNEKKQILPPHQDVNKPLINRPTMKRFLCVSCWKWTGVLWNADKVGVCGGVAGCIVRAGLTLAVETGGSLFCSAALKSCNDRFSAVFFWTRGPVIRAPFPTRSIPIDLPQRGARVRGCQCVRGWRVRTCTDSSRGSITRERALWQTDGKKLFICGGTKEVR